MTALQFDPRFSIGNVVTVAVVLFAAAGAWFTVINRQAVLTEKIALIEAGISVRARDRDQQIAAHEARIRAVEIAQASQSSDLRAIQGGIARIEAQLEKLQPKP